MYGSISTFQCTQRAAARGMFIREVCNHTATSENAALSASWTLEQRASCVDYPDANMYVLQAFTQMRTTQTRL